VRSIHVFFQLDAIYNLHIVGNFLNRSEYQNKSEFCPIIFYYLEYLSIVHNLPHLKRRIIQCIGRLLFHFKVICSPVCKFTHTNEFRGKNPKLTNNRTQTSLVAAVVAFLKF
jgi:hypothetical protein